MPSPQHPLLAHFEDLFPFHFSLGPDLLIRGVGPALARVLPDLAEATPLLDHLALRRPRIEPISIATLREYARSVFLFDARSAPLLLRGQLVCVDGDPAAYFLGSPWVTRSEDLETLGLSISDFAVHDPLVDVLVLMHAQHNSLVETRALAAELRGQRNELERTAAALADKIREVEAQRDLIRSMSTPVIEVWRGIVALPLIGTFDDQRAELLMQAALAAVTDARARAVLIDLTGVTEFDPSAVGHLLRTSAALRMLGARCGLVGISANLARALLDADVSLDTLATFATLQAGLRDALANAAIR